LTPSKSTVLPPKYLKAKKLKKVGKMLLARSLLFQAKKMT
jgi:hypothetical protein